MESILDMKKRQLAETEKEMNELGYAIGLENGDGKWEMADRFADGTETELDLKRIDRAGIMDIINLAKLSRKCLDLQKDIARMEGRPDLFEDLA